MKIFAIKCLGVMIICEIIVTIFPILERIPHYPSKLLSQLFIAFLVSYCIAKIVYWKRK